MVSLMSRTRRIIASVGCFVAMALATVLCSCMLKPPVAYADDFVDDDGCFVVNSLDSAEYVTVSESGALQVTLCFHVPYNPRMFLDYPDFVRNNVRFNFTDREGLNFSADFPPFGSSQTLYQTSLYPYVDMQVILPDSSSSDWDYRNGFDLLVRISGSTADGNNEFEEKLSDFYITLDYLLDGSEPDDVFVRYSKVHVVNGAIDDGSLEPVDPVEPDEPVEPSPVEPDEPVEPIEPETDDLSALQERLDKFITLASEQAQSQQYTNALLAVSCGLLIALIMVSGWR